MMSTRSKFFFSLALYCVFSVLLFFTNFFGFNVDREFEFWSLFFIMFAIAVSYGLLIEHTIAFDIKNKKTILILALSALFFIALFFFMKPPEFILHDLYIYFFHAKIFAYYHANPYMLAPADFAGDASLFFLKNWMNQSFNYGPLWLLLSAVPALLTANIILGVYFLKILILAVFLAAILASYYLFNADMKKVFLFAIHPLMLYWVVLGGHNDIALVFFLILSFIFLKKEKYFFSIIFFSLSMLVKYVFIIFLPIYILYILKKTSWKRIFFYCATIAIIVFGSYAPFHAGVTSILGSETLHNPRLSSPAFSLAYSVMNKSFSYDPEVFSRIKNIFIFIFIIGYAAILWKMRKSLDSFRGCIKIFLWISVWFYFITFWFQPWYVIWVLPCFIYVLEGKKNNIFFHVFVIFYSLIFYLVSYSYSSFFGLMAVLFVVVPLAFIVRLASSYPHKKGENFRFMV